MSLARPLNSCLFPSPSSLPAPGKAPCLDIRGLAQCPLLRTHLLPAHGHLGTPLPHAVTLSFLAPGDIFPSQMTVTDTCVCSTHPGLVPAQNCPALSGWALSGHHLRPELLSVPQLQRTALLAHESYSQGPTPAHPRLRAAILCHLQPRVAPQPPREPALQPDADACALGSGDLVRGVGSTPSYTYTPGQAPSLL